MKIQLYLAVIPCAFILTSCDSDKTQEAHLRRSEQNNKKILQTVENAMKADTTSVITPDEIFSRFGTRSKLDDTTALRDEEDKKLFKHKKVRWSGTVISAKSTNLKNTDYDTLQVELRHGLRSDTAVIVNIVLRREFDPVAKEYFESGTLPEYLSEGGSEVEFEGVVTGWSTEEAHGRHHTGSFMINCYPARIIVTKEAEQGDGDAEEAF